MRNHLIVGVALLLSAGCASADSAWPKIDLPTDANAYAIGQQMTVNGLPMRMQGFVSKAKPAQIAQWFRNSLGKPLVENILSNKLILGRSQGEHYISIQLEPIGSGTRGLVAVSQVKTAYENRFETRAVTERLLSRLPSGSRLVSQMTSSDGDKQAGYVVMSNTHNEDLNRDRLISMLQGDGLTLEREALAISGTGHPPPPEGAKTLFFKGAGKEAMAVIFRDQSGHTTVVLNTIIFLERFK